MKASSCLISIWIQSRRAMTLACSVQQAKSVFCFMLQSPFNSYWSEHRPLRHRGQSEVHLETWVLLPWQILWLYGGVGMEDWLSFPPMWCLPVFLVLRPAFPYFAMSLGKHFNRRAFWFSNRKYQGGLYWGLFPYLVSEMLCWCWCLKSLRHVESAFVSAGSWVLSCGTNELSWLDCVFST